MILSTMEKGKQHKCVICGMVLSTVYNYHKHNVRQHSLRQLSRAVLKLQQLQLPLTDPLTDDEDEDEEEQEEERKRLEFDMADVLDLPIKCELMDEEVIELGPTENADDLQVQSRLVKNPNNIKQQSRQIIEVQEDHPPPPACYINPAVEDPDSIVVKFNRELVMALDSDQPTVCTSFTNKKHPNRNLRAVFKSNIEIPDPSAFAKDYKQPSSRYHKYTMQNVILMDNPPKRRRGRPRKVIKPPSGESGNHKHLSGFGEMLEDEDMESLADPPLFSDNEDEEATAAMPSITRSRSGRPIKMKKEDGSFRYYDIPGHDLLDTEELSNQLEWKGDKVQDRLKGKYRRKRKFPIEGKGIDQNTTTVGSNATLDAPAGKIFASESDAKTEHLEVEVSKVEEGISMPLITHHIEDDAVIDVNSDKKIIKVDPSQATDASADESYACFLCFKTFNRKEDCEKHAQEHLNKAVEKSTESLCTSSDVSGKLLSDANITQDDAFNTESVTLSNKDTEVGHQSRSEENMAKVSCNVGEKSNRCEVCNITFSSKAELKKHSHELPQACSFCGKKYQSRLNLLTHIKKYHEETEWMKYKCAPCGKRFGFLLALERHMKEHNPNQKFCCEQCGKVFKSLASLRNHIPLHTKDEVFECPYCPKRYYIRYSYEKHLKIHECDPKYHCAICDRKFINRNRFEMHVQRHQSSGSHGRSKDYKCNNCGDIKTQSELDLVGITDVGHHKTCIVCGKGLYKRYRYIVENFEMRTPQVKEERQREQCKLCGKFVLNLARHIKSTHLGNEHVECDFCGEVVTKASLPSHKNRRHGGSEVTCDHCDQVFKNVMCLREHMAKVRKKEDPSRNVCKFCKEIVSLENWKEHMARHKSKCSDCGAAHFSTHEEFLAHLESCRRCSNCNLSTFVSREEYLSHIEICSSGIDVITSNLDSTSEQEVVTSIFAIVEGTTCEECGIMFSDHESLSQHIADAHPEALPADHMFGDSGMINEAILYACPKDSCGAIFTSNDMLRSHKSTMHGIDDENVEPEGVNDAPSLELGGRRYLYSATGFKSLI